MGAVLGPAAGRWPLSPIRPSGRGLDGPLGVAGHLLIDSLLSDGWPGEPSEPESISRNRSSRMSQLLRSTNDWNWVSIDLSSGGHSKATRMTAPAQRLVSFAAVKTGRLAALFHPAAIRLERVNLWRLPVNGLAAVDGALVDRLMALDAGNTMAATIDFIGAAHGSGRARLSHRIPLRILPRQ